MKKMFANNNKKKISPKCFDLFFISLFTAAIRAKLKTNELSMKRGRDDITNRFKTFPKK